MSTKEIIELENQLSEKWTSGKCDIKKVIDFDNQMWKMVETKCEKCGRFIDESENPLMCDKCQDRMEDYKDY